MKRIFRRGRPSPAMIVAILALVAALGGGAYAAQVAKNSVGAKQLKKNAVTAAKIQKAAVTKAKLAGDAQARWAGVDGTNGTILTQSGGITAERTETGNYIVRFGSSVAGRALMASAANFGTVAASRCGGGPGDATCAPNANNNPATVFVEIRDRTGAKVDANFTLAAIP